MRTKTLLIAAAALVAGVISSEAQTVYSVNVVGYVNIVTTNGFVLVNNALDYDGSGLSNTVQNLFGTNLPVNSQILTWNTGSGAFSVNQYLSSKSGNAWQNPNQQLPPGKGFFISTSIVKTNAFVGTVLQGGLTNQFLTSAGFSLIGGSFPVVGGITTTYGYKPSISDQVLTWNPSTGGYVPNQYLSSKSGAAWSGGEPQVGPGVGVFLNTTNPNPVMGTNFIIP